MLVQLPQAFIIYREVLEAILICHILSHFEQRICVYVGRDTSTIFLTVPFFCTIDSLLNIIYYVYIDYNKL